MRNHHANGKPKPEDDDGGSALITPRRLSHQIDAAALGAADLANRLTRLGAYCESRSFSLLADDLRDVSAQLATLSGQVLVGEVEITAGRDQAAGARRYPLLERIEARGKEEVHAIQSPISPDSSARSAKPDPDWCSRVTMELTTMLGMDLSRRPAKRLKALMLEQWRAGAHWKPAAMAIKHAFQSDQTVIPPVVLDPAWKAASIGSLHAPTKLLLKIDSEGYGTVGQLDASIKTLADQEAFAKRLKIPKKSMAQVVAALKDFRAGWDDYLNGRAEESAPCPPLES